jgi:hypothetical protein
MWLQMNKGNLDHEDVVHLPASGCWQCHHGQLDCTGEWQNTMHMLPCMQQHCTLTKVLCAMKMSMPNGILDVELLGQVPLFVPCDLISAIVVAC